MSFAKLLGGVKAPEVGSDVKDDAASPEAGKHAAAKRMIDAFHAGDHEGLSGALEDWHELRGPSGPAASAKPEDAEPFNDE